MRSRSRSRIETHLRRIAPQSLEIPLRNRHLQQILERMFIPLYALDVIRQSPNLEGIFQKTIDFTEHQNRILASYEQKSYKDAREVARSVLKRMKEQLGTQLPTA